MGLASLSGKHSLMEYALAGQFRDGLAPIGLVDGRNPKRVYIDKTGRVVLRNLTFKSISEFSDALALVEY